MLYGLTRPNKFDIGLGQKLPAAYRKFYVEWKIAKPTAVHFIPKEGRFERNELTGVVRPIQNVPLPIMYPPEHNDGIWGGEGVVKGYQKRSQTRRRVPHYWVPVLRRTVVYSQVLDKYLSLVVTDRTMSLVHESHGFDHYLLKTPACDLKSTLALKLKRNILHALQSGCIHLAEDAARQSQVIKEYKPYLQQYTAEEVEWYGLTYIEAIGKIRKILKASEQEVPLKLEFRSKLLQRLKLAGIVEVQPDGSVSANTVNNATHVS